MLKVTLRTSKRTLHLSGPTSWAEVSTALFQKMASSWDGRDIVQLFCILFGCQDAYDLVFNCADEEVELAVAKGTMFVLAGGSDLYEMQTPEFFLDKPVPKNIGRLTIGQAIYLRNLVEGKRSEECIAVAISVYMQPIIDGGEPNAEKMKELETKVLAMPITRTFPLGFFLLRRTQSSGNWLKSVWFRLKLTGIRSTISWLLRPASAALMPTRT